MTDQERQQLSKDLYASALFYDKYLNNREFKLSIRYRDNFLKIKIPFASENFPHLIGLHKLSDKKDSFKKLKDSILNSIINKNISTDELCSSVYIDEIVNRINNFKELRNVLFTDRKYAYGSISNNSFNSIGADFLLLKDVNKKVAQLFLTKDKGKQVIIAVPCTFFTSDYERNLARTKSWTIIGMEELSKKKDALPKVLSEKEVTMKNYEIRYNNASPKTIIGYSFIHKNEEYFIQDLVREKKPLKYVTIATLKRESDKAIFVDTDFASNNPFVLHLTPKADYDKQQAKQVVSNKAKVVIK